MKKAIVLGLVALLVLGIGAGFSIYILARDGTGARGPRLYHFASAAEFVRAFRSGRDDAVGGVLEERMFKTDMAVPSAAPTDGSTPAHSNTNVQVAGVDEADIVKNDGNFIYALSGNKLFIVAAFPAETARVLAAVDLGQDSYPTEMFAWEDRLIVMGTSGQYRTPVDDAEIVEPRGQATFIKIYDITDREEPALVREVTYEGAYSTARMIGPDVHVVLTTTPYHILYEEKDIDPTRIIPHYKDSSEGDGGMSPAVDYRQIDVIDPKTFTSFISIVSFSAAGGDESLNKRVVAGFSENVYASLENLYIASTEGRFYGDWYPQPQADEHTTVYKFALDGPTTKFAAAGEVPGSILNQFSMDEAAGIFRIATTRGQVWSEESNSTNNVYILGPDMKVVGSLEGLARGEKIYSVRFMGNRAYMVTFKKVDPLFVLDLTDPMNPRVLGELKIPGFSDYLHPYDETHIIGVGKNTVEAAPEEGGNFAWYQGMKIAIFDVSDVANPREMHKVEIGDRGTDSLALADHKAFLFDREKNLLVVPVLLAELSAEQKAAPDRQANDYGRYTFQGAYVYDVTLEGGFNLKGRITHVSDPASFNNDQYGYGYYDSGEAVRRSLWIGDNLYTASEARIKANRLSDLGEVVNVELR